MRILFAAVLMLRVALAASGPVQEIKTERPLIENTQVPEFRGGHVFRFDGILMACALDGSFAFYAPMQLPGVEKVMTYDVGVDPDGSFVVAASGFSGGRVALYRLMLLDAHGIQTGIIETKGFRPSHVAVDTGRKGRGATRSFSPIIARQRNKPANRITRRVVNSPLMLSAREGRADPSMVTAVPGLSGQGPLGEPSCSIEEATKQSRTSHKPANATTNIR